MSSTPLGPILVATDLTEASEAAVRFGAELARSLDAELVLFHAFDPFAWVDYRHPDEDDDREEELLLRRAEQRLNDLAERYVRPSTRLTILAVAGLPITEISKKAVESDVRMIVMGTHGRHPALLFLIGSVAQGVRYLTSKPIFTVPSATESPGAVRRILCPVNFTSVALTALEYAAGLAEALGAELTALHLVEDGKIEDRGELLARLHDWIPQTVRGRCCEIRVLIAEGNAAEETVKYAREERFDLIALGASKKKFVDATVLGTTTERVTRHSHCPVLTVMESGPA